MAWQFDNPWDSLTPTQQRRVKMRLALHPFAYIAKVEGVTKQAVFDSWSRACKHIPALATMVSVR